MSDQHGIVDESNRSLHDMVFELNEQYKYEKARRIYYQDIVYQVCVILDRIYGIQPGSDSDVICSSAQVKDLMTKVCVELATLRGKVNYHYQGRIAELEAALNGGAGSNPGAMHANLTWVASLLESEHMPPNLREIAIHCLREYVKVISAAIVNSERKQT